MKPGRITQTNNPQELLNRLTISLKVAYGEAQLASERQLGIYQTLIARVEQIKESLAQPKPKTRVRLKTLPKPGRS